MNKTALFLKGTLALAALTTSAHAQIFGNFEEFAAPAGNGSVMFRQPTFSGSNRGVNNAAGAVNISQVVSTAPAGFSGANALHASWQFDLTTGTPPTPSWLRLTTSGTANIPNPTIDFTQNLAFMIYTDRPVGLAIGVRETGTAAAIGANGGTANGIEFIGATSRDSGTSAPVPTRTITPGVWHTVVFDIDAEPIVGFAGATANGVLNGTRGVLEHLAFTPVDGAGIYNVYLDKFQVTPVPEPSTYAMVFGALTLGGAMIRRRFVGKA